MKSSKFPVTRNGDYNSNLFQNVVKIKCDDIKKSLGKVSVVIAVVVVVSFTTLCCE